MCPPHEWPQSEAGKLLEWLGGRAFDSCTHFEPIEVFRRGRIVDDFVYDFERQPGEEIRD